MTTATEALENARRLRLARWGWLAFTVVGLAVLAIGLPLHWAQWATVCAAPNCGTGQLTAQQAAQLPQLGLSLPAWAAIFTLLWNIEPLLGLGIAVVIFWRRPDDGMALFTCFVLIASTFGPTADYATAFPFLTAIEYFYAAAGDISTYLLLFVFPDGRFVPGWSRWLLPLPFVVEYLNYALPQNNLIASLGSAGLYFVLIAFQIYRYRRVSTAVQRQQTKWVLYLNALSLSVLAITGTVFSIYPLTSLSALQSLALFTLATPLLSLFPISIAIAVLRSRLWDIDLIIRRTLVYGALTALLALVYFASVVALQTAFTALTGAARSELVTVLSTLAIAALFVPVRGWLQALIDRRFYRRKYDTARTLAEFSRHARDQVELEALTDELLGLVQESMQPAQASLWLSPRPDPLALDERRPLP